MARGRSWGFDREQALEQAMLLFWERGYGGASYKTLLSAMAVPHPQSLIAAFGPKAKLFEAVLTRYWEHSLRPVLVSLETEEPIAALDALLDRTARLFTVASWLPRAFAYRKPQTPWRTQQGPALIGTASRVAAHQPFG